MPMWSLVQKNKKIILFCGLLLLAIMPVLVGIFHGGFFLTDDGNWMVVRLSAFYEALRQGQFPVRFLPRLANGFGYPVADFLYPLFLYIGAAIHIFHIPYSMTIKLLFGLSLFAGAIGSFLWLRVRFGNSAGFVGALVYTLFPYHLWDITKRGSLGEVLAFGVVPFIFWQIEKGSIALAGIFIALLILAHNTLALLFLPVIVCYIILLRKFRLGLYAILLGLGLSIFFWFPALYDKQFTVFDTTIVSQFSQYFLSGNLYSLAGVISFFIFVLAFISLYKKIDKSAVFFWLIGLLSVILAMPLSTTIWRILPLNTYVQFPFRFLSITTLCMGFLSAFIVSTLKSKKVILTISLIVILYFFSWQYMLPTGYQYYEDTFYSTNQDSTTVHNEYTPIWVKQLPTTSPQKIAVSNGIVENVVDRGSFVTADTVSSSSGTVRIAVVYFPGWQAKVDSEKVSIRHDSTTGSITFPVTKGRHSITVSFGETPQRWIADSISLLSVIIVFAMLFIPKISKRKK